MGRSYSQRAIRGKERNPDDQTCCVHMISSVGKASAVLNAVIGGLGLSLPAFAFTVQHAGISSRSHAKSGCVALLYSCPSPSVSRYTTPDAMCTHPFDIQVYFNCSTSFHVPMVLVEFITTLIIGRIHFRCGRLFMMESASSTHELFVLAKLTNAEDKGTIINKDTPKRSSN